MRRHPNMQPLSRDHQAGLVHSKRLREAADGDPQGRESAVAGFQEAWNSEIRDHFEWEERLLLPHLEGRPEARRLVREHEELRARAEKLDAAALDSVAALGDQLHDHIRWEERELFPLLEQTLSDAQLEDLRLPLEAMEASRRRGDVQQQILEGRNAEAGPADQR